MQPRSGTYSGYASRSRLHAYWMDLAKHTSAPIEEGLVMLEQWMRMEEEMRRDKSPDPYYYRQALLRLSVLSGSEQAERD